MALGIPIIDGILNIGSSIVNGVIELQKKKHALKRANVDNKIRMAQSKQDHNQAWEMRNLENAGWKDEVLFFAIIGMYVYSAVDPEGAKVVFNNWDTSIPDWFQKITMWMVAGVIGVKKIGDYVPGLIAGIKQAIKAK